MHDKLHGYSGHQLTALQTAQDTGCKEAEGSDSLQPSASTKEKEYKTPTKLITEYVFVSLTSCMFAGSCC
jgi:hypothetical protein